MSTGGVVSLVGGLPLSDLCESSNCRRFSATAAVVGFFFSFQSITPLISARGLGIGSEPGVYFNLIVGTLLLLFTVFLTVGRSRNQVRDFLRIPTMRWMCFFLIFSLASLAWSATVSPVASFFYWLELATEVGTVILLFRADGKAPVFVSLMRGFVASTAILALAAWIMPLESDLRLGDQEYFNTNQIGNLCALSIFFCEFLRARKAGGNKLVTLLLGVTLLRSLSKATLVAFVVAQLYILARGLATRRQKLTAILGSSLMFLIFFGLFQNYYEVYTTAGNQAETLTGRTTIWAYAISAGLQSPWVGNGIDSMWRVMPPFGVDLFEARHAENEFLQQFFAYGLVGVVVVIGLYWSLYRRIRSLPKGSLRTSLTALVIYIAIRGLAEAEPFDLLLPLWMITAISLGTSPGDHFDGESGESPGRLTSHPSPGAICERPIP